jgi:ankyrin repeat protein
MRYFKFIFQAIVFVCINSALAGSYEDFFQAAENNDAPALERLLQRGFDANTPGPKGQSALLTAIRQNASQAALVLARWPETRVDARTEDDETALMLAAFHNMLPVAQALIQRQADVNKPGWTPLHYAATKAHVPMMRFLLENHAFIDAPSPNGTTPLMMAAHYGTPMATKMLLEEGADPRLKNHLGLSAFDFAQSGPNKAETTSYLDVFLASWNVRYPVKP